MHAPAALGTQPRRRSLLYGSATAVLLAAGLLAPVPFLFACACTCGVGPAADAPEAPWQPALVMTGALLLLLALRRRGGGGVPPPDGRPKTGRHGGAARLRSAGTRLGAATVLALLALAAASALGAASASATPAVTSRPAAPACDCTLPVTRPGAPGGGVQGITVDVPSVGAGTR
jgi:hypothetical protein